VHSGFLPSSEEKKPDQAEDLKKHQLDPVARLGGLECKRASLGRADFGGPFRSSCRRPPNLLHGFDVSKVTYISKEICQSVPNID
jgi:hypothetical protein